LKIEEFVREVRAEASKRRYIRRVEIVEEGLSTAKILLVVRPEVKIQLYHNEKTGTTNLALILHDERIYGRNSHRGSWHRHPVERPWEHDTSREGTRPVSVSEFMKEIDKIVLEKRLV